MMGGQPLPHLESASCFARTRQRRMEPHLVKKRTKQSGEGGLNVGWREGEGRAGGGSFWSGGGRVPGAASGASAGGSCSAGEAKNALARLLPEPLGKEHPTCKRRFIPGRCRMVALAARSAARVAAAGQSLERNRRNFLSLSRARGRRRRRSFFSWRGGEACFEAWF